MHCYHIRLCHDTQVSLAFRDKDPIADPSIRLHFAANGLSQSQLAPVAADVGALAQNLFFKVPSRSHCQSIGHWSQMGAWNLRDFADISYETQRSGVRLAWDKSALGIQGWEASEGIVRFNQRALFSVILSPAPCHSERRE